MQLDPSNVSKDQKYDSGTVPPSSASRAARSQAETPKRKAALHIDSVRPLLALNLLNTLIRRQRNRKRSRISRRKRVGEPIDAGLTLMQMTPQ